MAKNAIHYDKANPFTTIPKIVGEHFDIKNEAMFPHEHGKNISIKLRE